MEELFKEIDYLFSKINWKDSAMDAKAIEVMNTLKSKIEQQRNEALVQCHLQIQIIENSEAYENGILVSDLFENVVLNPLYVAGKVKSS